MTLRKTILATALCLMAAPSFAVQGPSAADTEADRTAAFAAADEDGNGALSRDEFTAFVAALRELRADRHFAKLDADSNGEVSSAELAAAKPPRRGRPGGR